MAVDMIQLDLQRGHPCCRMVISGILEFLYNLSKPLVFFMLDCQSHKIERGFWSHVPKALARNSVCQTIKCHCTDFVNVVHFCRCLCK